MLTTKRKPATVAEILTEEFMGPMGLTQGALAEAMGVQRKHVNELCNNRRNVTAATALILARVFGNSPDFWLNVQRRADLWEAMNSPGNSKGSNPPNRWVQPVDIGKTEHGDGYNSPSERFLGTRSPEEAVASRESHCTAAGLVWPAEV